MRKVGECWLERLELDLPCLIFKRNTLVDFHYNKRLMLKIQRKCIQIVPWWWNNGGLKISSTFLYIPNFYVIIMERQTLKYILK